MSKFFFDFHFDSIGKELVEAKEKLAKAESSSSDSDDDAAPKRRRVETADRPTEEMIEKMEEKLEAANVDQKRLFLIVFQRFIMILSEHLVRCDTDGRDFDTDWYRWTIGRLQQVFLMVRIIAIIRNRDQIICSLIHVQCTCPFSITNKCKNTAAHWKHFCSHLIWIPTSWMFSNNLLL